VAEKKEKQRRKLDPKLRENAKAILDGSLLMKDVVINQIPFIIFLALLALIFIANRYHAEKVFVKTEETRKEIRELRSEKITVQSMLMSKSRQHEVVKRLEQYESDLKVSDEPPIKINYTEE
jgi:C4-dicarboxylate-specific signal transduction histidine kinase